MTVEEIMERANITQAGRALAWIKDALEEINLMSETHVKTVRIDIESGKRFYDLPYEMVKLIDIRVKDHENEDGTYKSIPRMIHEPGVEDTDGN
mgnify:CR=1 FL=1